MRTYNEKFPSAIPGSAKSQRAAILGLFINAKGSWVASPKIAALAQQYGARLLELRRLGFVIQNRIEIVDGARHSWFRLLSSPVAKPERCAAIVPSKVTTEDLPLFRGMCE